MNHNSVEKVSIITHNVSLFKSLHYPNPREGILRFNLLFKLNDIIWKEWNWFKRLSILILYIWIEKKYWNHDNDILARFSYFNVRTFLPKFSILFKRNFYFDFGKNVQKTFSFICMLFHAARRMWCVYQLYFLSKSNFHWFLVMWVLYSFKST